MNELKIDTDLLFKRFISRRIAGSRTWKSYSSSNVMTLMTFSAFLRKISVNCSPTGAPTPYSSKTSDEVTLHNVSRTKLDVSRSGWPLSTSIKASKPWAPTSNRYFLERALMALQASRLSSSRVEDVTLSTSLNTWWIEKKNILKKQSWHEFPPK